MSQAKLILVLLISIVLTTSAVAPIFILPSPAASRTLSNSLELGKWQAEDPAFSPDGQRVVFSWNRTGSDQIWIMNLPDGSHKQEITSVVGNALRPSFNSEGNIIAFLWEHDGFSDLCFVYLFSRGSCATHDSHIGSYYSWSPTGNLVAYDNGASIFLYNLDTNATSPFNFNLGPVIEPVFAPNGSQLYFSGCNDTQHAIWRANLDGSNLTRLSWTGHDVLPQLSQDARMLLYLTNYSGGWETWVENLSIGSAANNLFQVPPPPVYSVQSPQILTGTLPRFTPNGSEVLVIQDLGNGSTSLVLASLNYETVSVATGGTVYITPYSTITSLKSSCINDAIWNPSGGSILYLSCSDQLYLLGLTSSTIKNAYG